MKKTLGYTLVVLGLLAATAHADKASEAETFFLSRIAPPPDCLLKIQLELNGDDYPETLLTLNSFRNGRAGHSWQVFAGTKHAFLQTDTIISFRTDAVYAGYIDEIMGKGLLAYFPASSSEGSLVAYQLKKTSIIETNLGLIQPQAADAAKYNKYFQKSNVSIIKRPVNGGTCAGS